MSNIDIFSMAVKNLFKRKLRTFLTILGVVVGTAAIVIMVSLGIAMNESFDQQIQQMGDITIIEVYDPNYWNDSGGNGALNKAAVESFKNIKGVKSATPIVETYLRFLSGKYGGAFTVKGVDVSVMEDFNYKLSEGRILTETDTNSLNMIFGSEIPYQFEKIGSRGSVRVLGRYSSEDSQDEREAPNVDVINDKIKMSYEYSLIEKNGKITTKPYSIKGVGILQSGDWNNDYSIYMSITELEKIMSEQKRYEQRSSGTTKGNTQKKGYQSAYVKCESIDIVQDVCEEIKAMSFEAYSDMDYLSSMQEMSNSLQALLGAIGAVSLFIAAIGITNTMIMAIYERTREIGIMKVIGAQIKDIKKLFLLEAILIGFFGGIFGIGISIGVSAILNNVGIPFLNMISYTDGSKISSIPLWLCISALIFSSFVGLFSGYFPARRAMKLSALSAIKTE